MAAASDRRERREELQWNLAAYAVPRGLRSVYGPRKREPRSACMRGSFTANGGGNAALNLR